MKQVAAIENSSLTLNSDLAISNDKLDLNSNDSSISMLQENLAVLSSLVDRVQFLKKEISYLLRLK